MNTYDVEDILGRKHTIHADGVGWEDGMAIFLDGEKDIVAMFKNPILVLKKTVDTVH